ncbi:DNA cytosine methyltransferase [Streptomyces sp. H27-D2]|uniref:DNA cytosine methyltransferase n=1 Tax=Streptomyces sp. H27-D2 TaxID=3046304 RepID=UPI002DBE5EF1|nr:DNA cytosine methyltransferase [Streptomyces sp. H27-D2]MEC4016029.1 DNA cytosine methyltransferase [Streptomyces sp. H27-D2]
MPFAPAWAEEAAGPRIASLFTGTGALDLAVMDVYGGDAIWHSQYEPPDKDGREDTHQYAARILARHWPHVPNLGDITAVDWQAVLDQYGPVDILTGGFPCQSVSAAGQRAGLAPDTRSGLWNHMARAIHILQPRLVVIENVEGLLSAKAARGMGPDGVPLDEGGRAGTLRALGAVLGDLARLGLDAEWLCRAASDAGAPHRRKRVFINAWPADAARLGHERGGDARGRGNGPADGDLTTADAARLGHGHPRPAGERRIPAASVTSGAAPRGQDAAAADADGRGRERDTERDGGPVEPGLAASPGLDPLGPGVQRTTVPQRSEDTAVADAARLGRNERRTQPAGQQGRSDAPVSRSATLGLRPGHPDVDWGPFAPAIQRWEHTLGRPAPWPTDFRGRLSPVFTEWMQGYPDGWVTNTPGLNRNAMLRALGNGVVRLQAEAALRMLRERMPTHARLPLPARSAAA